LGAVADVHGQVWQHEVRSEFHVGDDYLALEVSFKNDVGAVDDDDEVRRAPAQVFEPEARRLDSPFSAAPWGEGIP